MDCFVAALLAMTLVQIAKPVAALVATIADADQGLPRALMRVADPT